MAGKSTVTSGPLGHFVRIEHGLQAFVPVPIPRDLELDLPMISALDKASRAVATLAGMGDSPATPPDPYLFIIQHLLRREAVLSSKIEGTQTSISDLFLFEASGKSTKSSDAGEVANCVEALGLGLKLLDDLPLCIRLVNQLHARLLEGVRGQEWMPGELRTGQVYAGPPGSPTEARYVPPPAPLVPELLSDWEKYVNEETQMPPLIQCALMHYQFEAIHPYLDGNGRVGRLLIILFLCAKQVLSQPLLYLSAYFERNRSAYYDHLLRVSTSGDWRSWVTFFLHGVAEQAQDTIARFRRVRELYGRYRELLQQRRQSPNVHRLLDELFVNPYITAPLAYRRLGVSRVAARKIIERLVDAGIVTYVSDSWPRLYVARELLGVIEAPVAPEGIAALLTSSPPPP